MPIPLIDRKQQDILVSVLSSIDEKIRQNEKINNNLEQQTQTLFKAWFINYIPFGCTMPSDWAVSTLEQSTKMGAGGDKPKVISSVKTTDCPYPIYSNGLSDAGLYGFTDTPKVYDESVTVSARGTIGFVCLRHIPYMPIVRLVTLIPDTALLSAKYLYLYLKQLHISGTGTTQQQLTVLDFKKTENSQLFVILFFLSCCLVNLMLSQFNSKLLVDSKTALPFPRYHRNLVYMHDFSHGVAVNYCLAIINIMI